MGDIKKDGGAINPNVALPTSPVMTNPPVSSPVPPVANSAPVVPTVSPVPTVANVPAPTVPVYPTGYSNLQSNDSSKKLWFMVAGAALLIVILLIGGYFAVKTFSSSGNSSTQDNLTSASTSPSQGNNPGGSAPNTGGGVVNPPANNTVNVGFVDNNTGVEVTPVDNAEVPSLTDLLNAANDTGEGVPTGEPSSATTGRVTSVPDTGFTASDGTSILIRSLACSSSSLDLTIETLSGSPSQILFIVSDASSNLQDFQTAKSPSSTEAFSLDISAAPFVLADTRVELGIDLGGNYTVLDVWACKV